MPTAHMRLGTDVGPSLLAAGTVTRMGRDAVGCGGSVARPLWHRLRSIRSSRAIGPACPSVIDHGQAAQSIRLQVSKRSMMTSHDVLTLQRHLNNGRRNFILGRMCERRCPHRDAACWTDLPQRPLFAETSGWKASRPRSAGQRQ